MKILICLFLVLGGQAKADILLEPVLGYEFASYTQKITSAGGVATVTPEWKGNGPRYGGRLGLSFPFVFLAGEYTQGEVEGDRSGQLVDPTDLAVLAGVKVPMLRAWVGYIFRSETSLIKGSGYKAGIGLGFLPFVSLNAEYISRTFDRYTGSLAPGSTFGADMKSYVFSVSLPLEF